MREALECVAQYTYHSLVARVLKYFVLRERRKRESEIMLTAWMLLCLSNRLVQYAKIVLSIFKCVSLYVFKLYRPVLSFYRIRIVIMLITDFFLKKKIDSPINRQLKSKRNEKWIFSISFNLTAEEIACFRLYSSIDLILLKNLKWYMCFEIKSVYLWWWTH